jgi:diguanylate cyclase (GGDEF)-like protein
VRFRDLPPAARLYVTVVCAAAALVVYFQERAVGEAGIDIRSTTDPMSWWLFLLLTCCAAVAHSFPVNTPDRQSYHVSPPFFLAGVILLDPLQLSLLMVAANAAERLRRRRSWFAQAFNVAAFVITAATSQHANRALDARLGDGIAGGVEPSSLFAGVATAAIFMILNHSFVSVAIWLGNGIPPHAQRLLKWQTVATEALLLSMGLPLSFLAQHQLWAFPLAAAPLLLIHRALELPEARAQRRRDGLTDLFSAEYLAEACTREVERASGAGRPLSVLALDIDGLARINNTYGKQEGDAVIRGVARRVLQSIRSFDVAARFAGGEIVILLPDCRLEQARDRAETIRAAVNGTPHDVAGSIEPLTATVSLGVAELSPRVSTTHLLLEAARTALATSKRNGGNYVTHFLGTPLEKAAVQNVAPPDAGVTDGTLPIPHAHDAARSSAPGSWTDRQVLPLRANRFVRTLSVQIVDMARATNPQHAMIFLQVLIAFAAAITLIAAIPFRSEIDPATVVLLWGLVIVADLRSFELFGGSTFAVSVVPHIAAGMLLGPAGALVVAPLSALVRGIHRRSRWYKVLFNCNVYVVAASCAAHVFRLTSPGLSIEHLIGLLVPSVLAGLAYYLHTLVIAAAMGTELQRNPLTIWKEQFRWLWPHYIVLSGTGLLLALAYTGFGAVGGAIFLVPTLMMHLVAKQYINRTLLNVRQLRTLNEKLQLEIAQREAAEQEMSRLAEAAARTRALEELNRLKNEFISIASHELRTPMTAIMGFSEILLDSPDLQEREVISMIHEEAVYLAALVENLLDVSRIEGGNISIEPTTVDLSDTVLPPLLHALGISASTHTLTLDVSPDARWVHADRTKLNQILTNLIGNAIKYSPRGGCVEVKVRTGADTKMVVISIRDQGIGIHPDHLERIFERFYRVDQSETQGIGGTGLGLFISRHLAELHGGHVWAESQPGEGSTFHLVLPAGVPDVEDVEPSVYVDELVTVK